MNVNRPPAAASPGVLPSVARQLREPSGWLRLLATSLALALMALVLSQRATPLAAGLLDHGLDKVAHGVLHFTLFWLFTLVFGLGRGLHAFAGCVSFAVLDEFVQWFQPDRTVSVADVIASAFGALLAWGVMLAICRAGESRSEAARG